MEEASKGLSNVGIKGRIKQLLILVAAIILGVIISSAVHAQNFHRAKNRHFKIKYRTQIRLANRECNILEKKRNAHPKTPLFVLQRRKTKVKSQAEVDTPGTRKEGPLVASTK
jgi:hypothetical protein